MEYMYCTTRVHVYSSEQENQLKPPARRPGVSLKSIVRGKLTFDEPVVVHRDPLSLGELRAVHQKWTCLA